MPKLDTDFKKQIKSLSKADLEDIVIRFASKHKEAQDFLIVNYFDKQFGEEDLCNEARNDIQVLFTKNYKGFSRELRLANMIEACLKRINEFDKSCKKKNLCADLIMMILDEVFSCPENLFGTCFTKFDYKVALLLRRLIILVTTRLHSDYKLEYERKINNYLEILHRRSNHIDFISAMPASILILKSRIHVINTSVACNATVTVASRQIVRFGYFLPSLTERRKQRYRKFSFILSSKKTCSSIHNTCSHN